MVCWTVNVQLQGQRVNHVEVKALNHNSSETLEQEWKSVSEFWFAYYTYLHLCVRNSQLLRIQQKGNFCLLQQTGWWCSSHGETELWANITNYGRRKFWSYECTSISEVWLAKFVNSEPQEIRNNCKGIWRKMTKRLELRSYARRVPPYWHDQS